MRMRRAPGWSAYYAAQRTGVPFLTSWYKGFREQNLFKRLYNGVMARGDRVVAISDQIAELMVERYRTPWDRITVIPASIDFERFDPARVSQARIDAMRKRLGRAARHQGHPGRRPHAPPQGPPRGGRRGAPAQGDGAQGFHVRVRRRGPGQVALLRRTLGSGARDRDRPTSSAWPGATDDLPAAFAAATVVVNAAIQPEGLQRAILEAEAMARPVVVSDLGAGPDAVLAPPAVAEDRMTGLRFSAGDSVALATALVRLFSLPPSRRGPPSARAGAPGCWPISTPRPRAEPTLRLYAQMRRRGRKAPEPRELQPI